MTDDRPRDAAPGDDSPWAPGGAMSRTPVPAQPTFFEPQPPAGERAGPSTPATAPVRPRRPSLPSSRWSRIAIAGALVVALVAGTFAVTRDGDPAEPVSEPPATAPTTVPTDPSTTVTGPFDEGASVGPSNELLVDDGLDQRFNIRVDLPSELDDLPPTELVVLGSEGRLFQVTTSTELARPVALVSEEEPRFAATDNAVVVWNDGATSIAVLRRDRGPIELDLDARFATIEAEADEEFLIWPASTAAGVWHELRVEPVVRTTAFEFDVGDPWTARSHPDGDVMVSDAAGSHLLTTGGPVTISAGVAVAHGRNHVLFRNCENAGACTFEVEDVRAGTRTAPAGIVESELGAGSSTISPDGASIVSVGFDQDGVPQPRIVDLATGVAVDVPTDVPRVEPPLHWAPDSSGLFGIAGGDVVFVDRTSGEVTSLGGFTDLLAGDVRQIAVRPVPAPDATDGSIIVTLTDLTGLDLVAFGTAGDVIRVDLDGRSSTTYEGRALTSGAPAYIVPDDAGVTVGSFASEPGFRLDYGGSPVATDREALTGRVFPGPEPGTFWRIPEFGSGDPAVELVDIDGNEAGAGFELANSFVLGSDGNGDLLVYVAGGIFVIGVDGASRLTDGEIVALGPTTAYARECNELLECATVRIDRATGEREPVTVAELATATADSTVLTTFGQTVSPDGDVVFVQASFNSQVWYLIDVAAGTVLEFAGPGYGTPIVWSDDSRYAAFLSSGDVIRVYDRTAGVIKELGQLPAIKTFAEFVPPAGAGNEQ